MSRQRECFQQLRSRLYYQKNLSIDLAVSLPVVGHPNTMQRTDVHTIRSDGKARWCSPGCGQSQQQKLLLLPPEYHSRAPCAVCQAVNECCHLMQLLEKACKDVADAADVLQRNHCRHVQQHSVLQQCAQNSNLQHRVNTQHCSVTHPASLQAFTSGCGLRQAADALDSCYLQKTPD